MASSLRAALTLEKGRQVSALFIILGGVSTLIPFPMPLALFAKYALIGIVTGGLWLTRNVLLGLIGVVLIIAFVNPSATEVWWQPILIVGSFLLLVTSLPMIVRSASRHDPLRRNRSMK